MDVNENACELDERGVLESIASKLAPTVLVRSLVGAGLPAMVVNDTACELDKRGVLEFIASKPAPTVCFSVGAVPCGSWLASDGR
ncbi:hypothetical protein CD175_02600 [Pseudomonas laurylsulfatiphila]|uniref:Uncharacterized protein n=1 Tax=Pseudomonas laurylsulfatiphila TaxID=2011015 RepID=A0A2S6FSI3_9PSED|nr:hypothetical protein CD175_02600 [Pseudomonas laurylsulfatiphila]